MIRRPTVRTTRLPPLLAVVNLHDEIAARLARDPDRDRAHARAGRDLSAWRGTVRCLASVDVTLVLPYLATPLPADRRGRVGGVRC